MLLCDLWSVGDSTAHSNHREQLQQVLRQAEEVGERRHPRPQQEVSEPVRRAQGQCGRDFICPRIVAAVEDGFDVTFSSRSVIFTQEPGDPLTSSSTGDTSLQDSLTRKNNISVNHIGDIQIREEFKNLQQNIPGTLGTDQNPRDDMICTLQQIETGETLKRKRIQKIWPDLAECC